MAEEMAKAQAATTVGGSMNRFPIFNLLRG